MLVVLQVRLVLPDVTGNEHESSQVKQRLAGSVVAVEVGGLILAPRSGWLLWSRGWAGWQLLVEGHNLAHSLSVSGATDVLSRSDLWWDQGGQLSSDDEVNYQNKSNTLKL